MYSLGVLPEVVETGETSRTVALKWAFASVLSELNISIYRATTPTTSFTGINQSYLMCLAKCSLLVKLKLHGG